MRLGSLPVQGTVQPCCCMQRLSQIPFTTLTDRSHVHCAPGAVAFSACKQEVLQHIQHAFLHSANKLRQSSPFSCSFFMSSRSGAAVDVPLLPALFAPAGRTCHVDPPRLQGAAWPGAPVLLSTPSRPWN
jgi:hypothetical protein